MWCFSGDFLFYLLLLLGFLLFCWEGFFVCFLLLLLFMGMFVWVEGYLFCLSQGLLVYFCYIAFGLPVLFFNSTRLRFHLSLPPYQFSVDTFILSLRFCYHLLFLEQFPVSIPSSTHTEITSATTTTSSKCLGL